MPNMNAPLPKNLIATPQPKVVQAPAKAAPAGQGLKQSTPPAVTGTFTGGEGKQK